MVMGLRPRSTRLTTKIVVFANTQMSRPISMAMRRFGWFSKSFLDMPGIKPMMPMA